MEQAVGSVLLAARDYDLAATLTSGQVFRWRRHEDAWLGVVAGHWIQLRQVPIGIQARVINPQACLPGLTNYLQLTVDLNSILTTFPDDEPMRAAVAACRGLRLLRQDPWECLASFILSSTKRILQIQQIVGLLCERFGHPVAAPPAFGPAFSFPGAERLARVNEADLRACKMGFRAPYLLAAAQSVAEGRLDLERVRTFSLDQAREALMNLPGVGRKIADCVLLFAYGYPSAFPIDVWVENALQSLYFPRRRATTRHLQRFSETHFGPNAGYAQQYLFHYIRTVLKGGSDLK